MRRLWLKIAALLIVLFVVSIGAAIAVAHVQGQQRLAEIRAFLAPPDGCLEPCFMGIRPGITTYDAALKILAAHEWVNELYLPETSIELGTAAVRWTWDNRVLPDFIDSTQNGEFTVNWRGREAFLVGETVRSISLGTTIHVHDLYTILGATELGFTHPSRNTLLYVAGYDSRVNTSSVFIDISTNINCPITLWNYWISHAEIQISRPDYERDLGRYLSPSQLVNLC